MPSFAAFTRANEEPVAGATTAKRGRISTALAWTLLTILLALPLTLGNTIGILAIACGLVAAFFVPREAYRAMLAMPHIWMLVASFILLAIAAVGFGGITSESLVALDFVPFLLAIPVGGLFRTVSIERPAIMLAVLALTGSGVGFLFALGQLVVLHESRPGAWLYNPIYFADLAVTLGFMAGVGLILDRGPRWWPILAAGPILGVATGILSGTRISLFIAGAQLILLIAFCLGVRARRSRMAALAVIVVVGGALSFAAPLTGFGRVLDIGQAADLPAAGDTVADASFGYRVEQYRAALRAFVDAPVFGHGWRHQMARSLQYMPAETRSTAADWSYIHNGFLNMLVGMGVFGGLAWVLAMAYPPVALIWAWRRGGLTPATAYMVLVVWLGFLVGGLTDVLFRQELTKSFYPFIPSAILMMTWRPGRPTSTIR